ncbi:response regulator [Noviherbaspirillum malthae]|uniref:response regulator n=1 Tax=Noviherbaspirillum malthae TaxID=1260987 RepID=UPI00188E53CA|nr:response regulator [Noviherbaspirillum malthae]
MLRPILLVEDNLFDLELTLLALERCNLSEDVAVVRDGEEAIDYLLQLGQYAGRPPGNPSFVLLDLKLPKMDGLDVIKKMRSTQATKEIPVVMFTSSAEPRDLETGYANGLNAYVVKPIEFSQFTDAVMDIGLFWTMQNVPPLGSAKVLRN